MASGPSRISDRLFVSSLDRGSPGVVGVRGVEGEQIVRRLWSVVAIALWVALPICIAVEAKANDPATATGERLEKMLQGLLAERFKLKVHRETRNVSGYRLVVAKSGLLKKTVEPVSQPPIGGRPGDMDFNGAPLDALATFLAMALGAPVQDKTGLSGNYSFSLHWLPSEHESLPGIPPDVPIGRDPQEPSLTTALKEQL